MSSMHARSVARGLHELADDIATLQRPVDGVRWYEIGTGVIGERFRSEPLENGSVIPIVPRAAHDSMCPALAVLIHDEYEEIVVCDRCKLAVENGAS